MQPIKIRTLLGSDARGSRRKLQQLHNRLAHEAAASGADACTRCSSRRRRGLSGAAGLALLANFVAQAT